MKPEVSWPPSGARNIAGLDMFLGMMEFSRTGKPATGRHETNSVLSLKRRVSGTQSANNRKVAETGGS